MAERGSLSIEVAAAPEASIAEDGSLVELHVAAADGYTVNLRFTAALFELFATRSIELFTAAKFRHLSIGDPVAIQAVPAADAIAQAPTGRGTVLASFRAPNGVPYHFALPPRLARRLSAELLAQARKAERG